MIGEFVYLNGEMVKQADAKISVFDHSFVYGDGIFEGLQAVAGGVFRLDDHVRRLYRSARYLEIDIPITPEAMIEAVLTTARLNGLRDGYIRPMISRGVGPMGVRNMHKLSPPTIVIVAQHEKIEDKREAFEQGITAHVASLRRIPPDCMDPRVKTCNYINNIMAYLEAKHAGADSAIMLDLQGYVAEGYGNNVFAVDGGTVLTPPHGNILAGITRQTVIDICGREGIPVAERSMTVYDLVTADEVFESATMAEIVPVVRIDGRTVGTGKPGARTRQLHGLLRKLMESGAESRPIFNA